MANISGVDKTIKGSHSSKGKELVFAPIPREFCRPEYSMNDPFQVVVIAGILSEARQTLTAYDHREARQAAKEAETRLKRKHKDAKQGEVTRAYKKAYRQCLQGLREQPLDAINITVTRRALMQQGAGFSGSYFAKLDTALDRLCEPVGELPPLLMSWQLLPSGVLRLKVNGQWLNLHFARIPSPLPLRSKLGFALYLLIFDQAFDLLPGSEVDMPLRKLADRLGIAVRPASYARRALERALHVVNRHIAGMSPDKLLSLAQQGIDVPESYSINYSRLGRVRLFANPPGAPPTGRAGRAECRIGRRTRPSARGVDDAARIARITAVMGGGDAGHAPKGKTQEAIRDEGASRAVEVLRVRLIEV
ncbi:hypothetical protein SAMN05444161_3554 [Rhizobiales bacterium GAS191]|nr:hypothetical protein SAMN05444161_3554 [Rhizobiales bacterium GAS191]